MAAFASRGICEIACRNDSQLAVSKIGSTRKRRIGPPELRDERTEQQDRRLGPVVRASYASCALETTDSRRTPLQLHPLTVWNSHQTFNWLIRANLRKCKSAVKM